MPLPPEIAASFPWLLPSGAFLLGACVGSFLNVVILRSPQGESVLGPGSRCAACGAAILARDNVPILGWLLRRGRARCCGAAFSFRYCAIELLTALLFLGTCLSFPPAKALGVFVFVSLLVVASFVDLDHQLIPDWLTLGGAGLGVLLSLGIPELHGIGPDAPALASVGGGESASSATTAVWLLAHFRALGASVQGLLIGSGLLLWIALVAEAFLKKEAMGFGDVKFVGLIGAFCGWQGAVFAIFGGAIIGTLTLGLARLFKNEALPPKIPFGPFLATAAVLYLFGGATGWSLGDFHLSLIGAAG